MTTDPTLPSMRPRLPAPERNPLEHYRDTGWREGREPSLLFDTTLYLIHNPDVAAAGVNPLEHFLTFGRAEGRLAYPSIGQEMGPWGFDAEFYLMSNPDVAAAGVDPLEHYRGVRVARGTQSQSLFRHGRISRALHRRRAGAGVNPLQHYDEFGWREGRDPSGAFDTQNYLSASPDVTAADVNPLVHFLEFGIYDSAIRLPTAYSAKQVSGDLPSTSDNPHQAALQGARTCGIDAIRFLLSGDAGSHRRGRRKSRTPCWCASRRAGMSAGASARPLPCPRSRPSSARSRMARASLSPNSVLDKPLRDPSDIARMSAEVAYNSMDLLQAAHTWSGVEMALWDLLGRARGEPVWKMLGYAGSHPKTPYASVLFGDTPAETLARAQDIRAKNFRAAKFGWGPIGRADAAQDAEHFSAAREGLGEDAILLVDTGQIFIDDVERAAAAPSGARTGARNLVRGAVRRERACVLWGIGGAQQAREACRRRRRAQRLYGEAPDRLWRRRLHPDRLRPHRRHRSVEGGRRLCGGERRPRSSTTPSRRIWRCRHRCSPSRAWRTTGSAN